MGAKDRLRAAAVAGLVLTGFPSAFAQNWTLTSAPETNWTSIACSADGNGLLAAAFGLSWIGGGWGGPIYVSTNSGTAWTSVLPTNLSAYPFLNMNWQSVASSADGARLFAAGSPPGDVIYPTPMCFSTDAGGTWTNTGTFTGVWESVAASADGRKLATGSLYGDGHRLHISTNFGNTWTLTSVSNAHYGAWSADGTTLVVCGSSGSTLATSTNQGATWSYAPFTNVYWSSVTASADGTKLVAAATGTLGFGFICLSTNTGTTWNVTSAPSNYWTGVASSADATKLVAAVRNGPLYTSVDSGVTWISNNAPKLNWVAVASSADGCRLMAAESVGSIYTWYTGPSPKLNITPTAVGLIISWVVPSMPFVLQENADLNTPDWTAVPTTPILNLTNLHHEVTVPLSGTNRFYRLRHL